MAVKQVCCSDWSSCCPEQSAYQSLTPTVIATLIMTVGGMADAFLYAYLPVNAQALGLSAIAVGAILSVNKFVRFFFNRWVNALARPWGLKKILRVALLLSAATAFTYPWPMPLWVWIMVRIAWGAAYSMFRFSSVQYAQLAPDKAGAMGITTALREIGPIAAYWLGPLILAAGGAALTFASAAFLTLLGIPLIANLPAMKNDHPGTRHLRFQKASWLDAWVFLSSFLADGLIIVAISRMIDFKSTTSFQGILFATAIFISLKRVFQIVLAPVSGWLIKRSGHKRIFLWSSVSFCLAVALLAFRFVEPGIILLFLAAAINNVCLPLFALHAASSADNYDTFTRLATAKDLGGAMGALLGLELLTSYPIQLFFAGMLLASIFILTKTFKFIKTNATDQSHS